MSSRLLKRIGAVILSAVMAFSVIGTALADTVIPAVTFDNLREPQPDLYVSKTVTSAADGYTAPDDTFTFVIKWNRGTDNGMMEFMANEIYYVYNEDGTQVWNDETDSYIFRTSATGRFTLKAGQYAKFEWFGEYDYEISELTPDGYVQTYPAGGESATGTVASDGTIVEFENTYIPEIEGGTTYLEIRKDIVWPDGFEKPDLSDVEFTFQVTIDGSAYGNQVYTLYDTDMNETGETGRTESDGTFSMNGDQVAIFEDVEVGVDYIIEEVGMDTGWRAVGETEYHGSTTAPIVYAYYADAGASFMFEKQRADGVTDVNDTFTFTLSNGTDALSGINVYIYDLDGNLVDSQVTSEDGTFSMKAGQKAIFAGLEEGTSYTVSEEGTGNGYTVIAGDDTNRTYKTPDAESGTVSYEELSDSVMVNEQLTDITIKKTDTATNNVLAGAGFTVYKLNDGVDPDSATDNDWTLYIEEQITDEDGTTTFNNLPCGTYKIAETTTPTKEDGSKYSKLGEDIIVTLPYTVLNEDVHDGNLDPSGFIYSEEEGLYYVYDLTYNVSNIAVAALPNTGSFPWQWIALAVVLAGAAGVTIAYVRKNRKENESEAV